MANKNAYELRTDILAMAQSSVMDKFNNEFGVWDNSVERVHETGQVLPGNTAPPIYPTTADILKTANELYTFVEAGDGTKDWRKS
jgi:hypothetical protein|tara:strand:+ start:2163 stop:2417 length:255 start_codon:yes stop_codon:yes gene_type:complete